MGAGDLAGDLRQGAVASSLELEDIIENNYCVCSPMPFPDEAGAGFHLRRLPQRGRFLRARQVETNRGPGKALPGSLRQPAEREFLKAIRDGSQQQVATDARRLRAAEPPPFLAQPGAIEVLQAFEA